MSTLHQYSPQQSNGLKVLLTGATGFIGSHVARLLVNKGCNVYAIVRPGSSTWRIVDVMPSINVLTCDLAKADDLYYHLEMVRPEMCIHLAWYMDPSKGLNGLGNISTLSSSLNLAAYLANLGCKKFLAAGTCMEYDTDWGYLSEISPTKPSNLYGASKLALHIVLEQIAKNSEMQVAWLRFFYLYGPAEDERRIVPSVVLSLLRDQTAKVTPGEQVRDYLYIEDAAAAIWAIAHSSLTGAVNVGSGKPVTVREVATKIGALLDKADMLRLGALQYGQNDPMFICANNRRLVENTAWTPIFSLDEGLQRTIEWWQGQSKYKVNYHTDGEVSH